MSAQLTHQHGSPGDYAAIESAVMETARGRWFLDEFARRNRQANTDVLIAALARLERSFNESRNTLGFDRFRDDLVDMARSIKRTRVELKQPAKGTPTDPDSAAGELDSIVKATEEATTEILSAAETVQEIAWTLRENGENQTLCDALDAQATAVYTACSFQDLTAQRISKVIQLLHYLEARLSAVIGIWGLDPDTIAESEGSGAETPPPRGRRSPPGRLSQSDIDFELVRVAPDFESPPAPGAPVKPRLAIEQFSGLPSRAKSQVFF